MWIWVRSLRSACAGALLLTSFTLVDASLFLHAGTPAAEEALGAEAIRSLASVCDWNKIDWDEMSAPERRAWMELGWTRRRWESSGHGATTSSSSKDWGDLTATEKHAAKQLGYDAATWDDDSCK